MKKAEKVWTHRFTNPFSGESKWASIEHHQYSNLDEPHFILAAKDVPSDEELARAWFAYTGLKLEPPPECIRFARFVLDGLKLKEEA